MPSWELPLSDPDAGTVPSVSVPLESLGTRRSFKRRSQHESPQRSSLRWPRWLRSSGDDADAAGNVQIERILAAADGQPYLPPLLPRNADGNPIARIPFAVISCVLFGEFLCAGVAAPFIFFMLANFGTLAPGQVGLWVGIVSATFFLAQFVTSLLWARLASRYGRRIVLATSLAGSAIATVAFGTSTSLFAVLVTRFAQGVFNGAVGVARATVIDIIDPTNEARAYALLGVCWSLGGSFGPILGGVLEHPRIKYPWAFDPNGTFAHYPYLLPCLVASFIPSGGALLCLFISRDGGHRTGSIALPVEKNNLRRAGGKLVLYARSASRTAAKRLGTLLPESPSGRTNLPSDSIPQSPHASTSQIPEGSAYGYQPRSHGSSSRPEQSSSAPIYRRASLAERFLLTNDSMSLVDLWVASALGGERNPEVDTNADHLSPHPEDDEDAYVSDDHSDISPLQAGEADAQELDPDQPFGDVLQTTRAQESQALPLPPRNFPSPSRSHRSHRIRRGVPALYRHAGVRTVAPITTGTLAASDQAPSSSTGPMTVPYLLIGLYMLLALHSSFFEQIFSVFLVTPLSEGGLGLQAGHFAALIAIMAMCQVVLQYKFYPRVGPPTGPLSHASMLRLGMVLYLPCYLLFPFLRPLGELLPSGWSTVLVMPAMVAISAVRYLASVSAFTSITILINALSPPHLVTLTNGLAQTATSAARCFGPIVGGLAWARSISVSPENYHTSFGQVAVLAFLGSCMSLFIR